MVFCLKLISVEILTKKQNKTKLCYSSATAMTGYRKLQKKNWQ